jgi:hypothetical protein
MAASPRDEVEAFAIDTGITPIVDIPAPPTATCRVRTMRKRKTIWA